MKPHRVLIATLCLFSACTGTPKPEPNHAADEARIRQTIDRAVAAFGAADAETLTAVRTEDSVVLKPKAEPLIGKQARRDSLEAVFAQFNIDESRTIEEIDIAADRAIVWGTYSVILSPKDGSPPINEAGNYIDVLHKQPDESWLFARTIWNTTSVTGP